MGSIIHMRTHFLLWNKTVEAITKDIPEFEIAYKDKSNFSLFVGKLVPSYLRMFTTIFPKVYLGVKSTLEEQMNFRVLQHEWVHLKDQKTFFGLLPFLHAKVNLVLFLLCYFLPHLLALLALLAITGNLWWLLVLLFLAPLPSPIRMISEMRGYRRSRELGIPIELLVPKFVGLSYYVMWPFKKHVERLLLKESPYKEEMDKTLILE